MAVGRNLPSKKYMAGERSVRRLRFAWDAENGGSKYIDLAKNLSQVNRRAYRQGLYYYVSKVSYSNNGDSYCAIYTIPDTWCSKAAWLRAFRMWNKMNAQAMADMPNLVTPKYHDFKIRMHQNSSSATTLDASYGNYTASSGYTSDEWVLSKFVTEDPPGSDPEDVDTFTVHMLGGHAGSANNWTSVGLLHSLNDVWRRPHADGEPVHDGEMDTDPIANLFDAGDSFDDVRLNLDQDNDQTPYNHDTMPGSSSTDDQTGVALMRSGSGAGSFVTHPGFCVPFGLLEVAITDFDTAGNIGNVELIIDLVPGSYHGVYAERVV